jgi:hypothetical protein
VFCRRNQIRLNTLRAEGGTAECLTRWLWRSDPASRGGADGDRVARRRRQVGDGGVSENVIEASWLALADSVGYTLSQDDEGTRRRAANVMTAP